MDSNLRRGHDDKRAKHNHLLRPGEGAQRATGAMSQLDIGQARGAKAWRDFDKRHGFNQNVFAPLGSDEKMPDANYFESTNFTSPDRVSNAFLAARLNRQRGLDAPPPKYFIYQHTGHPNFNIFHGFLLYPELVFHLAQSLTVKDLMSLYAISKDFHTIVDSRLATVIINQAKEKCPESAETFPFRCYRYLCQDDPIGRTLDPEPNQVRTNEVRKIPSFRWLQMVMFREKVCHEIMAVMAEDGVPMPPRCELALKKMWFLMEIPDNGRRIGYIHTTRLVEESDLFLIMCIVVKLDMRFNDPLNESRFHGLRKVLLWQPGLLPLWRALKRTHLVDRYEVMKMWVATKYRPPADLRSLPIFGIPADKVGRRRYEYWGEKEEHNDGRKVNVLLRADQLVVREIIRRDMSFSGHYLKFLIWGYVDFETLKNFPPRRFDRRIEGLDDEYEEDDACGGLGVEAYEKDPLLDLGLEKEVSLLVDRSGRKKKARQDEFLEACMKVWEEESKESQDVDEDLDMDEDVDLTMAGFE